MHFPIQNHILSLLPNTICQFITMLLVTNTAKIHILYLVSNLTFIISQSFASTTISSNTHAITTINSISDKPNIFHYMSISNRNYNYTLKKSNITDIYQYIATNNRNLFSLNLSASSYLFYSDESIVNLIKRETLLRKHYVGKASRNSYNSHAEININNVFSKPQEASSSEGWNLSDEDYFQEKKEEDLKMLFNRNNTFISSCSSCQTHDKAKKENLESIKQHILIRLQLSHPPNITVPPSIPKKILDNFYQNFNYEYKDQPSYKNNHIHKTKVTNLSLIKKGSIHLGEDEIMPNDKLEDIASTLHVDEFYSRSHNIYIFPSVSRIRHNRKPEIFNFKFNSDPSSISSTHLHVFIKGHDWLENQQSDINEENKKYISENNRQDIMVVVYRALRRPNTMNYTHTVKLIESRQTIPAGMGQWVDIEIKELTTYWLNTPNSTLSLVVRGMESWMRSFIVTEDPTQNKTLTMHIEILTKSKKRNKRNVGLDCHESDNEVRCCRYPLKVNFTNFGWNFIVAPQHFDAYFCNGDCTLGYLEKYTHTHLASLTTSAKPCCSPQKLSPLALLYLDNNNNLMYSTIPNMSVEKCNCS